MDKTFLEKIKGQVPRLKEKEPSRILSIDEIKIIRNRLGNSSQKLSQLLFVFEMAYTYGLSLDAISKCTESNYNYTTKTFAIGNKSFKINEFLSDMITTNNNVLKEIQKETIQIKYYPKISELTGVNFSWKDLNATRNKYFIRCPKCEVLRPNEGEFWGLCKHHDDIRKTYWFVCRDCIEKGNYE